MQKICGSVLALVAGLALSPAALAAPGAPGHAHESFAAGQPGNPKKTSRTIEVVMKEVDGAMVFEPARIEVRKGEQIRFVLTNVGELDHEFVLGTVEENAKHAELMQKFPEMEHDDPNGKQLKPKGKTELLWAFTKAGTFEYGCLRAGHYEAGMRGVIVVSEPGKARK